MPAITTNNHEMPYSGYCACHTGLPPLYRDLQVLIPYTIIITVCVFSFLDLVENMMREMPTLAAYTAIC
jgi:hypothetical protein